jgi:hypothetical protein
MLLGAAYWKYRIWDLERLMTFYEVRKNFPDPAGQHLIALVIEGKIDAALAAAKTVPGGINAAGTNGLTPLMTAVLRLDQPMVEALLAAGVNPNGDVKQVPLHMAVRARDLTIARTLLAGGADPNGLPGSEPPLMEAATVNYFEAAELLLTAGARADAPNELGETAAMSAAAAHHIGMTNYLLDRGASIWAASQVGFTVAGFAASVCERAGSVDDDCRRISSRIKAAGYPWPAPSPKEVRKLMDEGKWPPEQAGSQ